MNYQPHPIFFNNGNISIKDREYLVDWLFEIRHDLNLRYESIYLGIHILDCFLEQFQVNKNMLQCVDTSSLYIVSILEERCYPSIQDFLYDSKIDVFENCLTNILKVLKYQILYNTFYDVLQFSKLNQNQNYIVN